MKQVKTKATIGVLSTLIAYVSFNSLFKAVRPGAFIWQDEDREETRWIATSKSWVDRKACRWLGVCGFTHLHLVGSRFGRHAENLDQQPLQQQKPEWDWQSTWSEGNDRPEDWTDDERVLRKIPDYVFEYAPLVHLYSGEQFWPCDLAEHLYHVSPRLNYTPVQPDQQHPTLHNLDKLNTWQHGMNVFLTSNDNVEEHPGWLEGEKNIPSTPSKPDMEWGKHQDGHGYGDRVQDGDGDGDEWYDAGPGLASARLEKGSGMHERPDIEPVDIAEGEAFVSEEEPDDVPISKDLRRRARPSSRKLKLGGRSDAPAVLIVVNKDHGVVDAFWFFFYSFNLGNVVLNVRFGNHVGDWEHSVVRFHNGIPKAIFFSEHNFGQSYSYQAVEKIGKRPVIYSASGSHAMYATPGVHRYVLPWGLLHDITDRGPLWDPTLNSHAYTYDYANDTLRSSDLTPHAPTEWFYFNGHWGDKFYPLGDSRQYRFAGQYHYVNGPIGPRFKALNRRRICPGSTAHPCVVKSWIGGSRRPKRWQGVDEGDEISQEDMQRFFGDCTVEAASI